jgi:hypothetical protein
MLQTCSVQFSLDQVFRTGDFNMMISVALLSVTLMKQIFEVEEKPFTSSLNLCQEACYGKG